MMIFRYKQQSATEPAQATERLGVKRIPTRKPYYVTGENPDVWFEPLEVWELRGADLTVSPVHKAAVGRLHPDRGISLRLPLSPLSSFLSDRPLMPIRPSIY